jgi:hypothetical protein
MSTHDLDQAATHVSLERAGSETMTNGPKRLMPYEHIIDIPVYRCTEVTHATEMENQRGRWLKGFDQQTAPQTYARVERRWEQEYWYPWKFNEIVGYIRLYHTGWRQVKGDLHYVRAKRIVKGGKSKIYYRCKIFEHRASEKHTSRAIYEDLLRGLERLTARRSLQQHYLDLEAFRKFGPLIDWRQLLGN